MDIQNVEKYFRLGEDSKVLCNLRVVFLSLKETGPQVCNSERVPSILPLRRRSDGPRLRVIDAL